MIKKYNIILPVPSLTPVTQKIPEPSRRVSIVHTVPQNRLGYEQGSIINNILYVALALTIYFLFTKHFTSNTTN